MSASASPAVVPGRMSLVITVVEGGDTLRGILDELRAQVDAPELEILAPYDDSRPDIGALAPEYPEVQFFSIGSVSPRHPIASAGGQHELFDRRRAAGLQRGETLFLTPEAVVDYRTRYTSLLGVLPERFGWARLFGHVRARNVSTLARLKFILAGPLIPFVLFARHARVQHRRGCAGKFWRSAPWMFPMLCAWTAGEVWGAIGRRG